ncbi:HlyD family secretion protein (plasmid) [Pseudoalteromonas sp. T1lg65]|uniref:HlyD family secretion protein n=1 Tax=Pseudoalteromonas sp. T1lg65 TaxID=2077101 RepID=UPI003F7B04EA
MLKVLFLVTLVATPFSYAKNILLSGVVKAGETQLFYSPVTDDWRAQIQWMLPEGEVANPGDVVVVFDSGSIATTIDQERVSLDAAKDELERIKREAKQSILEAEYALKKAQLQVERARIDANVPSQNLSEYDYQQHQLNLEKAIIAQHKAQSTLEDNKIKSDAQITKQQVEIARLQANLDYNENQLAKMSLSAQRSGPILYADHPWQGNKLFPGASVQPGWKVAEIPSANALFMEAWIHEVDIKSIEKGMKTQITFDAYPNNVISSEISELSTQPEERQEWGQGMYYRAKLTFEQNLLPLLPGMSGVITLQGAHHE